MEKQNPRGLVYRCPVCGAEVAVVGDRMGAFEPVCCGTPMQPVKRRLAFYRCPVCGAEVAALVETEGVFEPRCCQQPMVRLAA